MPDRDLNAHFERRLAERLWAYSEQVLMPFDALEIAHRAALSGRRRRRAGSFFGGLAPAPLLWLMLGSLLVLALTATVFAAGWLRLPEPTLPADPSPTVALSPVEPTPSALPTVSPLPTVPPSPTANPGSPSAVPSDAAPTVAPATPKPLPTSDPTSAPSAPAQTPLPALGEWRRLDEFPGGDEPFVRVGGVTAGGPGFVAVGWSGDGAGGTDAARVWTSGDGQSWLRHSSPSFAGARLDFVVSHGGALFALGPIPSDDPDYPLVGNYHVWRSANGIEWELLPQPGAFAEGGVLLGVTATDSLLLAYGYRQVIAPSSEPAIWTSTDGSDWELADSLPDTWDVRGVAAAGELLLAIGNARSGEAPWRSLAYSTDGGRNWHAASAPSTEDPAVTLEQVGGRQGLAVAVGWRGTREDVVPFVLTSADGASWAGGTLEELPTHQFERVVDVPGGLLAFGTELRFELDDDCAPAPCEEQVPSAGRTWLSADGVLWQQAADLPAPVVWSFAGVAVGSTGVVVTGFDDEFRHGVWFAPLASPLP